MAISAFWAAYRLRSYEDFISLFQKPDLALFPSPRDYLAFSSYETLILLFILGAMGMYSLRTTDSVPREITKIIIVAGIWFMTIITYYFVIRSFPFSRLVLGYSWIFSMIFLAVGRMAIRVAQSILLRFGIGRRKVVFIGDNKVGRQLVEYFENSGRYIVAGVINSFASLPPFVERHGIEEVIQTKDVPDTQAEEILDFCRESHLQYHFVPSILEVHRANVVVANIKGIPFISLKPTPLDGWGKVFKRAFDITASAISLIVLLPVFFVIAIVIKLDSEGPVFFRHLDDGRKAKRVGQHGVKFQCLKFRTMFHKTHSMRYSQELVSKNKRNGSPLVKITDDPRVTGVGKFLRRYSLDELPQLWNVLIGEMSLVGPRPHLPEEVEKYDRHHKFVLEIKPGITGLAQVNGRSDLPFETEVRLDTYYIENWSLWIDVKILLKTLAVVARGYRE